MNRISIFILLLLFVGLNSCSEDPASPNTTTGSGKILIYPDSLRGVINEEYVFKARLEGVPFGDVRFLWDFGDGDFRNFSTQEVLFKFNFTDTFYVRVKAFDYFTDKLLGFDSIPVTITRGTPKVEITPSTIDSVISYYDDASFQIPISFSLTTSADPGTSKVIWYFGDGSKNDTISSNFTVYHAFGKPGVYSVRAEVYEIGGGLLGADTAQVQLRFPTINLGMIQSSKQVSVFLMLDKTSAFFDQPGFYNPSAYGAQLSNGANRNVTWSSNSLIVTEGVDSSTSFGAALVDRKLNITLSPDGKMVTSLSLSVRDSTIWQDSSKHDYANFSYSLKNIELLAVTDKEIVFRATVPTTTALTTDLMYVNTAPHTSQAGDFVDPMSYIHQFSSNPEFSQAVIVFTR